MRQRAKEVFDRGETPPGKVGVAAEPAAVRLHEVGQDDAVREGEKQPSQVYFKVHWGGLGDVSGERGRKVGSGRAAALARGPLALHQPGNVTRRLVGHAVELGAAPWTPHNVHHVGHGLEEGHERGEAELLVGERLADNLEVVVLESPGSAAFLE